MNSLKNEYEKALREGVKRAVYAGLVAGGLWSGMYGSEHEWWTWSGGNVRAVFPARSFVQELSRKGKYDVTLWRAEVEAKQSLYQVLGYTEMKQLEGREDPKLVEKLMNEKTLTISDVVKAVKGIVKGVFISGRTVEEKGDFLQKAEKEREFPWDTLPWENTLPLSKHHPIAGFVLVIQQEEKRERRSRERRKLTSEEMALRKRLEDLESRLDEATRSYEDALLEEGRRLEAYEEAKEKREAIEQQLSNDSLSPEERARLTDALHQAQEAEERAREAYEEAKKTREERESEKRALEAKVLEAKDQLEVLERRLSDLYTPQDVHEFLEMCQEGFDMEGRGKEDTSSSGASSGTTSTSSTSTSGGSSSSSSSEKKESFWSSLAQGASNLVSGFTQAVSSAASSVVQAASTAAAYVGQQAANAAKSFTSGPKINSQVYNDAWERARKAWEKNGAQQKDDIKNYAAKAMQSAEYNYKMGKMHETYVELYGDPTKGDPVHRVDSADLVVATNRNIDYDGRIDRALWRWKRGDSFALAQLKNRFTEEFGGEAKWMNDKVDAAAALSKKKSQAAKEATEAGKAFYRKIRLTSMEDRKNIEEVYKALYEPKWQIIRSGTKEDLERMERDAYERRMNKAREFYKEAGAKGALADYASEVEKEISLEDMIHGSVMLMSPDEKKALEHQLGVFLGETIDANKIEEHLLKAVRTGIAMYGGKEIINGCSSEEEFALRFSQKLIRASQSDNINEYDLKDKDGKLTAVAEEYEYFMQLAGYRGEKARWEQDGKRLKEINQKLAESKLSENEKKELNKEKKRIETRWGEGDITQKDFHDLWENSKRGNTTIKDFYKIENLSKNFLVLGEEGMGKGVSLKNGDNYNDRITVIRNGKIIEFNRANVDPTKDDPTVSHDDFRTLQPGLYESETFHWKKHDKFTIHIGYQYGAQMDRKRPQDESTLAWDILIHQGGRTWNGSHGCQTIYGEDYERFTGLFAKKDAKGKVIGYNYDLTGYYFLLTQ